LGCSCGSFFFCELNFSVEPRFSEQFTKFRRNFQTNHPPNKLIERRSTTTRMTTKIVGDFKIELDKKLGRGSYADVYVGEQMSTNRVFAVKVIQKSKVSKGAKLLAGLEAEINIMKTLTHENILKLETHFLSANNFYLVMELAPGGDLQSFLRNHGKFNETDAFDFLSQIAEGIAFIHENGFIHRDLKPANVLLSENSTSSTLKIADFGFARHLQEGTLAETSCGSPLYMVNLLLILFDFSLWNYLII
jgi:serine/threonine-protein kinase ULK2